MLAPYSIQGLGAEHIGYGAMTARFAEALTDRVELRDDAETVVFGLMPNMVKGWWQGQRTACMTMWETTTPPALFRQTLKSFDAVIVPSTHSAELFADMSHQVHVVPLGVDTDVWRPGPSPKGPFTFITGGSSWPRKGISQVISAFHDANLPDARLIVKLPDWVAEDPGTTEAGDNVTIMRVRLPLHDEVALYQSADCFVSGSRGEGFGMIPLQNVAVGNMVIAPGHTGHTDFSDLFDWNLSWSLQPAGMDKWPNVGDWYVPDHDEMVDAMRAAYAAGRPHHASRRRRWRSAQVWSWDRAADMLLDAFPPGGLVQKSVWQELPHKVEVMPLKDFQATIGKHKVSGRRGVPAAVPATTVQQLLDSELVVEL